MDYIAPGSIVVGTRLINTFSGVKINTTLGAYLVKPHEYVPWMREEWIRKERMQNHLFIGVV